jgi:hypothetical protein
MRLRAVFVADAKHDFLIQKSFFLSRVARKSIGKCSVDESRAGQNSSNIGTGKRRRVLNYLASNCAITWRAFLALPLILGFERTG